MKKSTLHPDSVELINQFRSALSEERVDDAERLLDELQKRDPVAAARPVYPTMLRMARGDTLRALQELGEDSQELRVHCLFMLQDPVWEGMARELLESSEDPAILKSMRILLEVDDESDQPSSATVSSPRHDL